MPEDREIFRMEQSDLTGKSAMLIPVKSMKLFANGLVKLLKTKGQSCISDSYYIPISPVKTPPRLHAQRSAPDVGNANVGDDKDFVIRVLMTSPCRWKTLR